MQEQLRANILIQLNNIKVKSYCDTIHDDIYFDIRVLEEMISQLQEMKANEID